ncbi:MAG: sporulation protein YqfD [Oscillospiraceae bacterium]|nr:sporulation protein YqfD [Oscillospiraceae bacterium]
MTGLLRFFRGWVKFRVTGGFPERFINLCAMRGFALWGARRSGETCTFYTCARSYAGMRACARGAGVRMKVMERGGLPFLLHRHRKRWGLVVGGVLCAALLAVSSCFLWKIEVVGNSRVDKEIILETLAQLGVKPGAYTDGIDVRSVERRMMMELEDLGWVAVNLQGSTAVVQVQERVLPPKILDKQQPCNVVAAQGGRIVEMRVYVGQSMVAKGDAVACGDILVSGVVEDADHDIHLVAARADITAQTDHTLQVELPLEQTVYDLQRLVRRYSLKIGSLEIPLWVGKPPRGQFRLERMYTPLRLFGKEFPLWVGKRQYLLLQERNVTLTLQQAAEKAEIRLRALEQERFAEAKILDCSKEEKVHKGIYRLAAAYTVEENIAVQAEIFGKTDEE